MMDNYIIIDSTIIPVEECQRALDAWKYLCVIGKRVYQILKDGHGRFYSLLCYEGNRVLQTEEYFFCNATHIIALEEGVGHE